MRSGHGGFDPPPAQSARQQPSPIGAARAGPDSPATNICASRRPGGARVERCASGKRKGSAQLKSKTPPPPSREKIAQAKLLYDAGAPIPQILDVLSMSVGRFRRFRETNDWPLRDSACARKTDSAEAAPRRPAEPGHLIARLEDAVEREFARAEAALEKHAPKTIEASARTLATLVKTSRRIEAHAARVRRDAKGCNAPR